MKTTEKGNNISAAPKLPSVRLPSINLVESGKVRVGGQGPLFRKASVKDVGNVRLGGQGPIFR